MIHNMTIHLNLLAWWESKCSPALLNLKVKAFDNHKSDLGGTVQEMKANKSSLMWPTFVINTNQMIKDNRESS